MYWRVLLLVSVCMQWLGEAAVVEYEFDLRDWVVDYRNPTKSLPGKATRKTPFKMDPKARKAAELVNGQYPGPLIEAMENDTIVVTVLNNLLSSATTIHWHGIHVVGTPWEDGPVTVTQAPILPGQNYTYRFLAYPPGTHYWHSHMDAMQMARGVRGPIVVHAQKDPFKDLYDEEKVVCVSDEWENPEVCLMVEGAIPGNPVCREIDIATINGHYGNGTDEYPYPLIEVEKGKCYRLRWLNMGSNAQNYITTIAGHNLTLLAIDSYDVKPINVSAFNVHVGERYDLILCADQPVGTYLINMTYDLACPLQPGNFIPPGMAPVDACSYYGFIKYKKENKIPTGYPPVGTGGGKHPKPVSGVDFNLNLAGTWLKTGPYEPEPQPEKVDYRFEMNLGVKGEWKYSAGTTPLETSRWYMYDSKNPMTWRSPSTPILHTKGKCGAENTPVIKIPESAQTVEIVINNLSPTAHVLHMHGMYFQVINYGNFSWCNNIDPYDTACFLMPSFASKCPKEDLIPSNPKYPLMQDGLWWGCKYNAEKDAHRQILKNPIRKDMISVWRRSWVVIRLKPINPGFWLFHCHMEQHIPEGMITVLNLLESQQTPVPHTVPTEGPCPFWSPNTTNEQ